MSQAVFDAYSSAEDPSAISPEVVVTNVNRVRSHRRRGPEMVRPISDRWAQHYRARLIGTDIVMVSLSVFGPAFILDAFGEHDIRLYFTPVTVLLWLASLAVFESRNTRTMGTGTTEYKAIVDATLVFLGVMVILSVLSNIRIERTDVIPAVPLGLVLLLLGRWSWRQWLRRERNAGRGMSRTVLVGSVSTVTHTAAQLARHPDGGYLVVGSITPDRDDEQLFQELTYLLDSMSADTVMVTSSDDLTPERMRRLSWSLEGSSHRLVVTPSLTDVAGSRIQTQPVAGLPLIHVERPNYTGAQRLAKRLVDILGSTVLLAFLAPVLIIVAAMVKVTSPGPVFYRQERIGRGNEAFGILKFRSMAVDADTKLAALLAAQGTAGTPLFKVRHDPRLTPIGAVLRRYSLDELPQLVNVLRGEMSLVGPRPQRPAEVALYDSAAHRRLAVCPGMTGLWQVSGRSRLSWDESLRLDLYYIENWSLVADLMILWRTFKAVVGSDGAI